jgi:guanylate kinase
MIVLVGASASGKTELAKILFQLYGYTKCITTTTREPRQNEVDGIDYHFLSMNQFLKLKDDNSFLEVTEYNNHLYGIQRKDVKINGVVIVDPQGANAIEEKIGKDAFIVYVHTSEPLRKKRMIERKDAKHLIEERLKNDANIFKEEAFYTINLILENEQNDLYDLANHVHHAYQSYINQQK